MAYGHRTGENYYLKKSQVILFSIIFFISFSLRILNKDEKITLSSFIKIPTLHIIITFTHYENI